MELEAHGPWVACLRALEPAARLLAAEPGAIPALLRAVEAEAPAGLRACCVEDTEGVALSLGDGALWRLDARGSVHARTLGQSAWRALALGASGEGPGGAEPQAAWVYEPSLGAPLRVGGEGRNDAWVAGRKWRELRAHPRPPHGLLHAAPERDGVWLAGGGELWWCAQERFECRGHAPGQELEALAVEPAKGELWACVEGHLCAWARARWQRVCGLPGEGAVKGLAWGGPEALWLLRGETLWRASAGELEAPAHAGAPTVSMVVPVLRHAKPPPDSTRRAAAVFGAEGFEEATELRLVGHEGWSPPEGFAGLALRWSEGAVEATLARECSLGWEGGVARYEPFVQVDPELLELVDTPEGSGPGLRATRVGGYAPEGASAPRCEECRRRMTFAALWLRRGERHAVFVCTAGCGAQAVALSAPR